MTDKSLETLAQEFALEVEAAVLKLEHIATGEGGCPHFDDGDSRSCNDCRALRVRSVLESRTPLLLRKVAEDRGEDCDFCGKPLSDAACHRCLRSRDERAKRIVATEEELDGPIPHVMLEAVRQHPDVVLRAIVRSTKKSILRRLEAVDTEGDTEEPRLITDSAHIEKEAPDGEA